MRKTLYTMIVLLFVASTSFSQFKGKGDMVGQVGIGYGHAGIYGDMGFPPISLGLQYGIEDKISIGGIVGYSSSSDEYRSFNYSVEWTYTYIFIGARGEYHFLENSENMDAYAGLTLGYDIVSSSVEETGTQQFGFSSSASGSYALWGAHAGLRYYFSPKFGLFAELGYGVSYITAGVAFKL